MRAPIPIIAIMAGYQASTEPEKTTNALSILKAAHSTFTNPYETAGAVAMSAALLEAGTTLSITYQTRVGPETTSFLEYMNMIPTTTKSF